MAKMPTKLQAPDDCALGETPILDALPVMETVEFQCLSAKEPDDSGNDEDVDSLGIGSITVADLTKILEDGSPTDEMPVVQDDDTFV